MIAIGTQGAHDRHADAMGLGRIVGHDDAFGRLPHRQPGAVEEGPALGIGDEGLVEDGCSYDSEAGLAVGDQGKLGDEAGKSAAPTGCPVDRIEQPVEGRPRREMVRVLLAHDRDVRRQLPQCLAQESVGGIVGRELVLLPVDVGAHFLVRAPDRKLRTEFDHRVDDSGLNGFLQERLRGHSAACGAEPAEAPLPARPRRSAATQAITFSRVPRDSRS